MNFGYRDLRLASFYQVDALCRGNPAYGWLQGELGEPLEGFSRLPHIDAANATVLLVVDMHERASWQMGVDVHLVCDGVDHLHRDSGRENLLNKDGHDWLPPGGGQRAR